MLIHPVNVVSKISKSSLYVGTKTSTLTFGIGGPGILIKFREVIKGMFENADKALHNGERLLYGLKVNPQTRKYEIDETRCQAAQISKIKKALSVQLYVLKAFIIYFFLT